MSDFIFKMKVLFWLLFDSMKHWHQEVWKEELDALYCCSGRECACGGMTHREYLENYK